jgi:hypothetical protein
MGAGEAPAGAAWIAAGGKVDTHQSPAGGEEGALAGAADAGFAAHQSSAPVEGVGTTTTFPQSGQVTLVPGVTVARGSGRAH